MAGRALVQTEAGVFDAEIITNHRFKPGDGVRLKFGHAGYIMNVVQYVPDPSDGSERAVVIWLRQDGGLCEAALPEDNLEAANNN